MAFYLYLFPFIDQAGHIASEGLKSGPFATKQVAEQALAGALGSGRFGKGEISGDTL